MTGLQQRRWHHYPDVADLMTHAAAAIERIAAASIAARGAFHLVLAGGNTPNALYQRLAQRPAQWEHWHVYWGDERCVAPDHPDRNSLQAHQAWLDHVAIPAAQIHPIPAELGHVAGAQRYSEQLAHAPTFDLVLLGLGEDGHTASLFPGHLLGEAPDAPIALAVDGAPKPPPQRVSLSARRLSDSHQVFFLVTGAAGGKQAALQAWRADSLAVPATAICPANGVEIWLTD